MNPLGYIIPMTELEQISIEDAVIKKEVPILEGDATLRTLVNDMVRNKVSTAIMIENDRQQVITTHDCAEKIVRNIWDLDVIIDRLTLRDMFNKYAETTVLSFDKPVKEAIDTLLTYKRNFVVEEDGTYYEITAEDMLPLFIIWEDYINEKPINEVMSTDLVKVPPTQSAASTYEKYTSKNLTAAIVTNPAHQPIGIVTNRDYTVSYQELLNQVTKIRRERDMKIPVEVVMKKDVIFEFHEDPLSTAINTMVENDIGHIPIVDEDDETVGMIYKYALLQLMVKLDEGA